MRPHNESLLRGKTICFLGSSVTFGAASLCVSMADYIGVLDSCTIIKEAVSGTTMAGANASTYVGRLLANVNANANIDIFICQLSTNDASKELPLGEVSSGTELNHLAFADKLAADISVGLSAYFDSKQQRDR